MPVNLDEMAALLKCSLPTMRKLAKLESFPVIARGSHGVPWQLDPEAVTAFLQARREAEAAAGAARDEALAQLSLPESILSGDEATASAAERLKTAQAIRAEILNAREAGFLVSTTDMRARLASAWPPLMQSILAMPQQLGRRHNLPDAVVRDARRYLEEQLRETVRLLQDLLPDDAAPNEPHGAPP